VRGERRTLTKQSNGWIFKLHFCHSASLHFTAKVQLKNHRLSQRYVGQEIKNAKLRKVRKSKSLNPERAKLWLFWLGNNVPRSLTFWNISGSFGSWLFASSFFASASLDFLPF
jgi:hypothetical protein